MAQPDSLPLTTYFRNSVLHVEKVPKWIRCVFAGETIGDSKRAVILRSKGARRGTPVYLFPLEDVRTDCLRASGEIRSDPHIGEASYQDLVVGQRSAANSAWIFGSPHAGAPGMAPDDAPDLRGYAAFDWAQLDAWFEEDEEVYQHARDPYKRIDCLPSSRHVRVLLDGVTVAETTHPVLLFETGLITRYYIPKLDVRLDLLREGSSITRCPYKGLAHYFSVETGGRLHEDIAWFYPHSTPEASRIAGGYIAFYEERVDRIEVDGVANPKPVSHFRED